MKLAFATMIGDGSFRNAPMAGVTMVGSAARESTLRSKSAQDAEARSPVDHRLFGRQFPARPACEGVVARAEEGEVVVGQPAEEFAGFLDFLRRTLDGDGQARQTVGGADHLGAHRLEIGVDHGDVLEGFFQPFLQVGALVRYRGAAGGSGSANAGRWRPAAPDGAGRALRAGHSGRR